MIVDSHCHLDYPSLYDQLDQVINRAEKNDIKYLLTICTTIESYKKIELIIAPAKQTLVNLPDDKKIDFAFIDADKGGYLEYYEEIVPRLSDHGLIAIDNVLWSGRVINQEISDDDTVSIRKFNDHVSQDDRVSSVMLSIGDGITLVKRTN